MLVLALDTATPAVVAGVAELSADGVSVRAQRVGRDARRHGELLMPSLLAACSDAGVALRDAAAVVVGIGPGPFTGLRVGLVTARTLAMVLEIPVYGVCGLDVLAVEAVETGAVTSDFLVATDARRKEVYLASYDADGARVAGPGVTKPAEVATDLPVVGEGALLYPDAFSRPVGPTRVSAGWLARVVADERAELHDPEPLYLRRPDAVAPSVRKPVS